MAEEANLGILDIVIAELVECAPEDPPSVKTELPPAPDQSPVQRAADATIAQTGADPPPGVMRG
jgi:hypothetical protein